MFDQREKHLLYTALMFYTRIPVPADTPYSPELLNQSRKYFTTIGLIIGVIGITTFALSNTLLPPAVAVLLSMIACVLATGAFHEDGFADSCDALGGGWQPEQILTIMKDSRIGTYGTVGLIAVLGLKYALLLSLLDYGLLSWCLCVIAAHSVSRLHSSRLIKHYDYVQDIDKSKVKPIADAPLTGSSERFSMMVGLVPCGALLFQSALTVAVALLFTWWLSERFMAYCQKRVGGYTGDILGAVQQITEVGFLIACLAFL